MSSQSEVENLERRKAEMQSHLSRADDEPQAIARTDDQALVGQPPALSSGHGGQQSPGRVREVFATRDAAVASMVSEIESMNAGGNAYADVNVPGLAGEVVMGNERDGYILDQEALRSAKLRHERLDVTLDGLPSITALPRPRNAQQVAARLNARRDAALDIASNAVELADAVLKRGDVEASGDLLNTARRYQAEASRIDAKRV
ncbi:hypothetical protein ACNQVK_03150 [Mycobacterium sp. 134]|uniref:hypothetical protein n=1 Tax=Mycobacterium sp. 134 TaxID=3400425 RepID=UPI003AAF703B